MLGLLVACHSAARALQLDECDTHLVVGINLMLLQESSVGMAIAGMTSPTGRSHTFDSRADGFARGEGASTFAMTRGEGERSLQGARAPGRAQCEPHGAKWPGAARLASGSAG